MARRFYTFFFYLITPLILLRLLYRAIKAPAYRYRVLERFGIFKAPSFQNCIWVHAVSVGETLAAVPLIKQLQQNYPDTTIVITTMTPTGSERVRAAFSDSVFHVYAPYDLPGSINRFLQKINPRLLLIMETELWPNTLQGCKNHSVPVLLANARLSEKSAAGYRRFSGLTQPMLMNISKIVAQTSADGERFIQLGLPKEQLQVSGSIKFDVAISDELKNTSSKLREQWCGESERIIAIAASTHEGEDEIIFNAFNNAQKAIPNLLLLLVPRHPERFDSVFGQAEKKGFAVQRRSAMSDLDIATQVIVGDTMGELFMLYGVADFAFVGGSLVNTGGHNMLEPAAWGIPIITGESDFNFLEISRLLQQENALCKVADTSELAEKFIEWSGNEVLRNELGHNALQVVEANRGALKKLLSAVAELLK